MFAVVISTPVVVVHDVPLMQVRVRLHGLTIVGIHGCRQVNITVAGHEVTTDGVCVTPALVGLGGCGHGAKIQ